MADINVAWARLTNLFTSGVQILSGTGSPEGVVVAHIGSIYFRLDGGTSTSFYIKEANNTTAVGWVAK